MWRNKNNKPGRIPKDTSILLDLQQQIAALAREMKQLKMSQDHNCDRPSTFRERRSQSPRHNYIHQNHQASNYQNSARRQHSRSRGRSPGRIPSGYCKLHTSFQPSIVVQYAGFLFNWIFLLRFIFL